MTVTTLSIDCRGIGNMASFWERYVQAVGAENCVHFGRNLDALWDALSAGGPGWPEVDQLVFRNSDALMEIRDARGTPLLQSLGGGVDAYQPGVGVNGAAYRYCD